MINTGAFYFVYRYQYEDAEHHTIVSDSMATLEYIHSIPAVPLRETARRVPQCSLDPLGRLVELATAPGRPH